MPLRADGYVRLPPDCVSVGNEELHQTIRLMRRAPSRVYPLVNLDFGTDKDERARAGRYLEGSIGPFLAAHWPDTPNIGDITAVDWTQIEPVDVLCGGFPCQDVSSAGLRAGIKADNRSGLWAMFAEAMNLSGPADGTPAPRDPLTERREHPSHRREPPPAPQAPAPRTVRERLQPCRDDISPCTGRVREQFDPRPVVLGEQLLDEIAHRVLAEIPRDIAYAQTPPGERRAPLEPSIARLRSESTISSALCPA